MQLMMVKLAFRHIVSNRQKTSVDMQHHAASCRCCGAPHRTAIGRDHQVSQTLGNEMDIRAEWERQRIHVWGRADNLLRSEEATCLVNLPSAERKHSVTIGRGPCLSRHVSLKFGPYWHFLIYFLILIAYQVTKLCRSAVSYFACEPVPVPGPL
jgi:hypothetical protein